MSTRIKRTTWPFAAFLALALSSCPMQPKYQPTITPIYAATDSGLYIFDGANWRHYASADGLASNKVLSLAVSGSGSGAIVFAGTDNGVSRFDGSAWSAFGLAGATVNDLFLNSSLIAATSAGLSSFDANSVSPGWISNPTPGISHQIFNSGSYTYAASNFGFYIFNGPASKTTIPPNAIVIGGAASSTVYSVLLDQSQNVFVGTDRGLAYYDGSTFTDQKLTGVTSVLDLFVDSYGTVYSAGSLGLYIGTNSSPILTSAKPINCVCVDGAGTIYAGTASGLQISKDGGTTWSTSLPGIKVNAVLTTAPLYSF
jgi:ligand-binding sensor domain-containing protein